MKEKMKSLCPFSQKYHSVDTDDEAETEIGSGRRGIGCERMKCFVRGLLVAILAFLMGFFAGQAPKISWGTDLDGFPGQFQNFRIYSMYQVVLLLTRVQRATRDYEDNMADESYLRRQTKPKNRSSMAVNHTKYYFILPFIE